MGTGASSGTDHLGRETSARMGASRGGASGGRPAGGSVGLLSGYTPNAIGPAHAGVGVPPADRPNAPEEPPAVSSGGATGLKDEPRVGAPCAGLV